jgi:hypothetical protein
MRIWGKNGSARQKYSGDRGHLEVKEQLSKVSYLLLWAGRQVVPNPSAGARGHRRS